MIAFRPAIRLRTLILVVMAFAVGIAWERNASWSYQRWSDCQQQALTLSKAAQRAETLAAKHAEMIAVRKRRSDRYRGLGNERQVAVQEQLAASDAAGEQEYRQLAWRLYASAKAFERVAYRPWASIPKAPRLQPLN